MAKRTGNYEKLDELGYPVAADLGDDVDLVPALSETCRPGKARDVLRAIEAGESITARGFRKRFGLYLSKLKNDVGNWKGEDKDAVLAALKAIK